MNWPEQNSDYDDRLDQLIAEYLEREQSGTAPERQAWLRDYPEFAEDLRQFFGDHDRLNAIAEPLRDENHVADHTLANVRTSPPQDSGHRVTPGLAPTEAFAFSETRRPGESTMDSQPRQFGDYELLNEIARGGMGVVYRARQISLNRIVAVKMILGGQLAGEDEIQRFHAEAEAAANLNHPGIVPIYEVGQHEGRHYFSMGFVEGCSLAERLREGPMPAREAARLLTYVCEAVQHAHEHGVIHRDLKPGNILLEWSANNSTDETETTASQGLGSSKPDTSASSSSSWTLDARPRITDFGLAKRLQSDSHLTGTGQILGTPSFMSPEQAAAAADRVGPVSDVYSVGAILYQMLTGRPPFQAETSLDTLMQVLDADVIPPRVLNPNAPRDLESICMKCLERDPSRRYESAREIHDELQRFLDGEQIHASSVNVFDRMTRLLRQSRHEEHFRGWGLGLIAFGAVIAAAHTAIFALEHTQQNPLMVYWLPRSAMFVVLLIMLWRFRPQAMLPTNSAERLVWVVWIGYLLAVAVVNVVIDLMGIDQKQLYAFSSLLSGMGFLVMGVHVWGGGYIIGLIFMLCAPALAVWKDLASLAFGLLWGAALVGFGMHYRRIARKSALPRRD